MEKNPLNQNQNLRITINKKNNEFNDYKNQNKNDHTTCSDGDILDLSVLEL